MKLNSISIKSALGQKSSKNAFSALDITSSKITVDNRFNRHFIKITLNFRNKYSKGFLKFTKRMEMMIQLTFEQCVKIWKRTHISFATTEFLIFCKKEGQQFSRSKKTYGFTAWLKDLNLVWETGPDDHHCSKSPYTAS